jgi:hypothetical protein
MAIGYQTSRQVRLEPIARILAGGISRIGSMGRPGATDASKDVRYCAMRFKSYDPVTGTYLGYDGRLHPCP